MLSLTGATKVAECMEALHLPDSLRSSIQEYTLAEIFSVRRDALEEVTGLDKLRAAALWTWMRDVANIVDYFGPGPTWACLRYVPLRSTGSRRPRTLVVVAVLSFCASLHASSPLRVRSVHVFGDAW